MVFSDPVFLFAFMPCCLLLLWAGGWRVRNQFLIAVGTVFYIWGGRGFVLLLAASVIGNHLAATRLARWRTERPAAGRRLVQLVVVLNLTSIGVWKYGGFAVAQTSALMRAAGLHAGATVHLALPIAISFYTFQCISYVIDVWRGTSQPAPKLTDFAAYILLFPHLIAGPIVRYADIEHDLLTVPAHRYDDFVEGAPRFFWGLAKKVMVADQVAAIANASFDLPYGHYTTASVWIGALAYAVQIYFDFSGYSDMAIGLARMLGFHFPENFNRPYSAVSITDFWRRWHMSLSSWFRDYVYIPLGGNRRGPVRTYANLSIVFLLTGLWHGANWTFIVWGLFHGACLVIERLTGLGVHGTPSWAPLRRLVTFTLVCLGWVLFRSRDLPHAMHFFYVMFLPHGGPIPLGLDVYLTTQRLFWWAVGISVIFMPADGQIGRVLTYRSGRSADALRLAMVLMVAPLACMYALSSTFSPFLYFQF